MNQDFNKNNNNSEEVDLIRLLNYFKNGVKSIFRGIWRLIELMIEFIILLKKYWILVVGFVVLGAMFGKFIYPSIESKSAKRYEMVVRTNPIANFELYSYATQINNPDTNIEAIKEIGLSNTSKIHGISIGPIKKLEDEIQNYFQQIEGSVVRGFETDTLYFQKFDISSSKSNLEDRDYSLQKIVFSIQGGKPNEIQKKFIDYFNSIPAIKNEQQAKYNSLNLLEGEIKTSLDAIDSLLFNKAKAAKSSTQAPADQVLVNTASRGNVEADLLYNFDKLTKKLYGVQKAKAEAERGVTVISNLRIAKSENIFNINNVIKYAIIGFILASLIVLAIQFNKYLNDYSKKRNEPYA